MPLVAKLQLHLAGKDATWSADGATWSDAAGKHLLLIADHAPTGEELVDAHLRARSLGATLTVAHEGAPGAVAVRTAARFRIQLLDASALPEPGAGAYAPALPALAAPPPEPLLPAHEPDTPLPWDPALRSPEVEPAHVEPIELLAMPWAHEGEHVEVLEAGRATRPATFRPTQAPDWGLPWPRPMAPMDGVAKVDPKLWQVPERIAAVREDLERAGATSLGAVRPEGSAWLKRITEFGAP